MALARLAAQPRQTATAALEVTVRHHPSAERLSPMRAAAAVAAAALPAQVALAALAAAGRVAARVAAVAMLRQTLAVVAAVTAVPLQAQAVTAEVEL